MATPPLLTAHTFGPPTGLPLLIIHGWELAPVSEIYDFEPILSTLPTPLHRIYLALPGMDNTPSHSVHDLDDMLALTRHFITSTLSPNAPFLVAGTSCGALFARAIALEFGDRCHGLLLRVPLIEPDNAHRDVDAFAPLVRNDALLAALPPQERESLGDVLVQTPEYIAEQQTKFAAAIAPALRAADAAVLDPIRNDPARYRLRGLAPGGELVGRRFEAPALVVCGRQDEVVGWRDAVKILESMPRASLVVVDRGGHGLPVDEGARRVFKAAVEEWVSRVVEWRGARGEA